MENNTQKQNEEFAAQTKDFISDLSGVLGKCKALVDKAKQNVPAEHRDNIDLKGHFDHVELELNKAKDLLSKVKI